MALRIEAAREAALAIMRRDWVVLAFGVIVMGLAFDALPRRGSWDERDCLAAIADMLRGGGWVGDVAQDQIGLRRLVDGRDPYPILGPALRELGVSWDVSHASTHPPMAFLLAAPIAWLPQPVASRVWALLCIGLAFGSGLLHGLSARRALGLALAAASWKPAAMSFHQITFIWLFGVSAAYRWRETRWSLAGFGIGLAALTKLMPLGMTIYFVLLRRYRAALVALGIIVAAVSLIYWLQPSVLARYSGASGRSNSWQQILREDNFALVRQAHLHGGVLALLLALAFLGLVLLKNWRPLLIPHERPEYSFILYSSLAVLLLPILWHYSLLPLLPALSYFFARGRAEHVVVVSALFLSMGLPHHPAYWLNVPVAFALFLMPPPAERPTPRSRRLPRPASS